MAEPLEIEGRVFDENIDAWRDPHMGKFVLIHGQEVIGFYDSLEGAFSEGSGRYGLDPFFVRQIVPEDSVNVSFFGERILAR